jgi:hypothetical protein
MTKTRANERRITNRATNSVLKNNLGTSKTIDNEGPQVNLGATTQVGNPGLRYEPLPPVKEQLPAAAPTYWTMERYLSALGGIMALIGIVIFFIRMDSNVSDLKASATEEKDKIGKLDEKASKQTVAIEMVTGSVQRLESEVRRTQDYIQQRNR